MATLPSAEAQSRFVTLDIVRGVAVMGILAMNIVGFAMPLPAYFSPLAATARDALDGLIYAINFVFIDGKMRGLFSFLFGASMLLVIDKASELYVWHLVDTVPLLDIIDNLRWRFAVWDEVLADRNDPLYF